MKDITSALYQVAIGVDTSQPIGDILRNLAMEYDEKFNISYACVFSNFESPNILDVGNDSSRYDIVDPMFQSAVESELEQYVSDGSSDVFPIEFAIDQVQCYGFSVGDDRIFVVGNDSWRVDDGLFDELSCLHSALDVDLFDQSAGVEKFVSSSSDHQVGMSESGINVDSLSGCLSSDVDSQHEKRPIEILNLKTNEIFSSHGEVEVCEHVVDCVSDFVGVSNVSFHIYNRKQDCLIEKSTTNEDFITVECTGDSLLWDIYDSKEKYLEREINTENTPIIPTGVGWVVLYSVGGNGILTVGYENEEKYNKLDRQFCILLTSIANSTLNRIRRINSLETVNSFIRDSIGFDDRGGVIEEGVDRVVEALDLPVSAVWKHNAPYKELIPVSQTDVGNDLAGEQPVFTPENSVAWDVFASGESQTINHVASNDDTYNSESPIQSEYLSPIGEYGVLASGSPRPNNISEVDERVAEALVSTLETSIRHVDGRKQIDILENVVFRVLRHNVRNKMGLIGGYVTSLQGEFDHEHIDKLSEVVDQVNRIFENARMMRSVVYNRNEKRTISPNKLIYHAIESVDYDDCEGEIVWSDDVRNDDYKVVCHPHMSEALEHLLHNGVKYGIDGGEGVVEVSSEIQPQEGVCEITISDDGNGLPDHEIEALNDKSETALEHGSGIGLWIADRVVDYSDGDLSFEVSSGTVVTVTLQLK